MCRLKITGCLISILQQCMWITKGCRHFKSTVWSGASVEVQTCRFQLCVNSILFALLKAALISPPAFLSSCRQSKTQKAIKISQCDCSNIAAHTGMSTYRNLVTFVRVLYKFADWNLDPCQLFLIICGYVQVLGFIILKKVFIEPFQAGKYCCIWFLTENIIHKNKSGNNITILLPLKQGQGMQSFELPLLKK